MCINCHKMEDLLMQERGKVILLENEVEELNAYILDTTGTRINPATEETVSAVDAGVTAANASLVAIDAGVTTANIICLGNKELIINRSNSMVIDRLEAESYIVHNLDLDEFAKGMGGPNCLIMPVTREA